MPATPHIEKHFTAGDTVRDVVIGMSDGLTVPFALAAGFSGAVTAAPVVITAGLAEVAAGSIAMALGGYLAARSDAEHYASELQREEREIVEVPDVEAAEVADGFRSYGLTADETGHVVAALRTRPQTWRDFMMRFELGLEAPDPKRALRSALTIAAAYADSADWRASGRRGVSHRAGNDLSGRAHASAGRRRAIQQGRGFPDTNSTFARQNCRMARRSFEA